ncbi:uncharacterized protein LOC143633290 [Bidens hawaiensis]|uniref:uncharacterized protein LOC143633290 n=1 Tax=Bidens hawaiensis TaxID=980011 RepID=UPI0040497E12
MRKKSMASGCSSFVGAPETGEPPVVPPSGSGPAMVQQSSETKVDLTCNGDAGHNQSSPDVIPEEEEARLLRLMGWEESAEVECLTDEEIHSFYQHLLKVKPTSKGAQAAQPKLLTPMSSNSKLDF